MGWEGGRVLEYEINERPRSYRESCSTKVLWSGRGDKKACSSAQVFGRVRAMATGPHCFSYYCYTLTTIVIRFQASDHIVGCPPPKDRSTAGTGRSGCGSPPFPLPPLCAENFIIQSPAP